MSEVIAQDVKQPAFDTDLLSRRFKISLAHRLKRLWDNTTADAMVEVTALYRDNMGDYVETVIRAASDNNLRQNIVHFLAEPFCTHAQAFDAAADDKPWYGNRMLRKNQLQIGNLFGEQIIKMVRADDYSGQPLIIVGQRLDNNSDSAHQVISGQTIFLPKPKHARRGIVRPVTVQTPAQQAAARLAAREPYRGFIEREWRRSGAVNGAKREGCWVAARMPG